MRATDLYTGRPSCSRNLMAYDSQTRGLLQAGCVDLESSGCRGQLNHRVNAVTQGQYII